jgi:hypothetical protein
MVRVFSFIPNVKGSNFMGGELTDVAHEEIF